MWLRDFLEMTGDFPIADSTAPSAMAGHGLIGLTTSTFSSPKKSLMNFFKLPKT